MQAHFVVLPPTNVAKKCGELAKKYSKKFPSYFALDNKRLIPHITLFTLEINKKNWLDAQKSTAQILGKFKKLNLAISRHSYYLRQDGDWLALKIKQSTYLSKLRTELFSTLKKLDASGIKLKHYSPHITLTKFKPGYRAKAATKGSQLIKLNFTANTVAICQDAGFSQVYKIIKQFKLK